MRYRHLIAAAAIAAALLTLSAPAQQNPQKKKKDAAPAIGYDDTPMLPGQKWRVHDIARPRPRVITPGANPGDPPSDAIVLFNGKDLSEWQGRGKRERAHETSPAAWKVSNGYIEVVPDTPDLETIQKFGDCQLHIEWATPAEIRSASQLRGNSGVLLMSRYEIQVLDSWDNITYADGQAGSIYGQWPPLVNAARRPGAWQSYDIVFEAPQFDGDKVVKPAYATVFHNGVVLHNRQPFTGRMAHRIVGTYAPHGPEEPLMLQNHGDLVRYRNIWIRPLRGYDQP